MAQTLYGSIKGFCTRQENAPIMALQLVLQATDHMLEHRDWDALAYFLGHAPSNMRSIARRIVGEVVGGVRFDSTSKIAKAHRCKCVFKLGENFGPTEKLEVLRELVEASEKITSKAVKEAFPLSVTEKTHDEKLELFIKAIRTRMDNDGLEWSEVISAFNGA